MSASVEEILQYAATIAVVGASRDASKPSATVPLELQEHGYRVIPVNPHAERLFGERCYRRLGDIRDRVDVVEVFRPSAEAADIAREAVAIGARALWLQYGIQSEEARRIAGEAGLDYVEGRCMAVERAAHDIEKGRRPPPAAPPPPPAVYESL